MLFPEVAPAARRELSATECPAAASARLLSTAPAKWVRPDQGVEPAMPLFHLGGRGEILSALPTFGTFYLQ